VMGAMFMKPSGRSSYAGLLPAGRKKVELLIISALLQPCHRSLQAKRPLGDDRRRLPEQESRAPHIVIFFLFFCLYACKF